MRFLPFIIFFLYIYLEISLFITVANTTGVFAALLLTIFTSLLGLSLIKSKGLKNSVLRQNRENNLQSLNIVRSTSNMVAGIFLLIPGFLTDIIGLLLLLPPIQILLIGSILPKMMGSKINFTTFFNNRSHPQNSYDNSSQNNIHNIKINRNRINNDDIIEGEFTRKEDGE